ncbi:hypothetical protein BDV36DRAFT_265170 [Aspergillus pseudocaelatus]|uniref:Amino acid permease/ SLC12A domain-containing protein n=1 Tax=Aspergillus pseudocaelatus TaxID=1825620 RepID=A0ABQ6WBE6_9EURO|nr:hypothetical protein BDV36DRAFT_265170 [Aspergillus pseudocaelatus]
MIYYSLTLVFTPPAILANATGSVSTLLLIIRYLIIVQLRVFRTIAACIPISGSDWPDSHTNYY